MKQLFALILLLSSCTTSGGFRIRESTWASTTQELGFRAGSDLGPCVNREYTLLQKHWRGAPLKVGVAGCGQVGVYEHRIRGRVSRKAGASWELVP